MHPAGDVLKCSQSALEAVEIGVSTSAWPEHALPAALERISTVSSTAEIRSFGRHSLLDRWNRVAVMQSGLTCSVHGPFGDEDDGIGSPVQSRRRAALNLHRRHLLAAADIGATVYVVHPDLRPVPGPRDAFTIAALERSIESLRVMQDEADVPITIENMPIAGCSHFTHPGDLDLCGLGLTLDVGHASISDCLGQWLDDPHGTLRHVHLHDNSGPIDVGDPHGPLGSGVIDCHVVLSKARSAGASVVLEHYRERDVCASLIHLRRLALLT